MSKQVVILAAGMGTRLARPLPKPLTELRDGRSIMKQQLDNLKSAFGDTYRVLIVVGYKLEAIIERFPEATFVYNEYYDQTNTSKSLLKALRAAPDGGVLWLNGDVVFDGGLLVEIGAGPAVSRASKALEESRALSLKLIERLGAQLDGMLRAHQRMADGTFGDPEFQKKWSAGFQRAFSSAA